MTSDNGGPSINIVLVSPSEPADVHSHLLAILQAVTARTRLGVSRGRWQQAGLGDWTESIWGHGNWHIPSWILQYRSYLVMDISWTDHYAGLFHIPTVWQWAIWVIIKEHGIARVTASLCSRLVFHCTNFCPPFPYLSMVRTRNTTQDENNSPRCRAALTDSQKAKRQQRFQDLKNDLTGVQNAFNDSTQQIAEKYGRFVEKQSVVWFTDRVPHLYSTERWTKRQMMMASLTKHRKPNPWNGFVKEKHEEASEGMWHTWTSGNVVKRLAGRCWQPPTGCLHGERLKLPKFISENGSELKEEYEKLTKAEKDVYRDKIASVREEREVSARANPKAVQAEVRSVFGNLQKDVSLVYTSWSSEQKRTHWNILVCGSLCSHWVWGLLDCCPW